MGNSPAGGPDLVQGNSTDRTGQPDNPADLVFNTGHADLIGPHVRGKDILVRIPESRGKSPEHLAFFLLRHLRVPVHDDLSAPVGQVGSGIFQGHGPRQPETLLGTHIRRHPDPADGRPPGHIVHHKHCLQINRRFINVNDFKWPELISKSEHIFH